MVRTLLERRASGRPSELGTRRGRHSHLAKTRGPLSERADDPRKAHVGFGRYGPDSVRGRIPGRGGRRPTRAAAGPPGPDSHPGLGIAGCPATRPYGAAGGLRAIVHMAGLSGIDFCRVMKSESAIV